MGVQDVKCDKEGTVRAGDYIFFSMEKNKKVVTREQDFLYTTEMYQL